MKKVLTLLLSLGMFLGAMAQPFVSITNINAVTQAQLQNCDDTSNYLNQTIRTVGVVYIDGGLSEVASGSVQGGLRPFIFIVDTANGGAMTPFSGIEVMGVIQDAQGNLIPHPNFVFVAPGDIVEITGKVSWFERSNQMEIQDANSFNVIGTTTPPSPAVVPLADLNDPNGINQMTTGEQWEGAYAELQNVTVSEVIYFAGGSRVSFNVVDANGNRINVSDRFLAQKLPSHQVLNPNSPNSTAAGGPGTGTFVPPVPGTFYNSISGAIRQSANGCTGGTGRGYEINPFLPTHYNLAFAPPFISNVDRDPIIPTSNQSPDITLNITDFDGSVAQARLYYTSDPNIAPSQFTMVNLSLVGGTTDEYEASIPAFPNGTLVRYYIYAEDNDGNKSYFPAKPLNQTEPNFTFYTVRNGGMVIPDIQYTLASNGDSPYVGKTVTVKGYATSSTKPYDLGYVYIQDPNYTEWSGIALVGTNQLTNVFRGEELIVTGDVVESFGFTQLNVSSVTRTGNVMNIAPVDLDPTDSAMYASRQIEKYEGMLVRAAVPGGNKLWINETNMGFGDYSVSSAPGNARTRSLRVLAGRQSSTAFSSLYVSVVTDTIYRTRDGFMEVTPIAASDTMNMDALVGVLSYGFSNYRIQPRNNDDFIGFNVPLDSTNLPQSPFIGVDEPTVLAGVMVYPNPNNGVFRIGMQSQRNLVYRVLDLNGRVVLQGEAKNHLNTVEAQELPNGLYVLMLADLSTGEAAVEKLVIQK